LRKQEEVDLAGCQAGILKMAGRTGIARLKAFLGVEVIDE